MSPSSPVSVGILPSNRTLDVNVVQISKSAMPTTLEQCSIAEEPFTGDVPLMENSAGKTGGKSSLFSGP